MRLIKLAIISIVLLFAAATAVSLLIPSRVRISKAINLHDPQPALALIWDTTSWHRWHPAFMNDTLQQRHPIHFALQEKTDSSLRILLRQGNKRPIDNGWIIHRYASSDSITLQWYMDFQLKWYPWQKFSSMFFENTYGRMMEEGLGHIREITEGESLK